jgi:hypothetical protein
MFKKGLCIIVFVLFFPLMFEAKAMDFMGPPTAGLKQGQSSVGIEYMRSNMDIEADGIPELGLVSTTVENVEMNKIYENLGLGITDDAEIFLRLGAADAEPDKGDNSDNLAGYIGGSDFGFAIGGGIKATLSKSEDDTVKWGILAQMSWADLDFDTKSYSLGGYTVSGSAEVEIIEVQVAVGPTVKLREGISIYGGPFLHIIDGDADLKSIDGWSGTVSTDLEEDSAFGGYVGTQIDLDTNTALNIEGQFTGGGWGVGGGIVWKF